MALAEVFVSSPCFWKPDQGDKDVLFAGSHANFVRSLCIHGKFQVLNGWRAMDHGTYQFHLHKGISPSSHPEALFGTSDVRIKKGFGMLLRKVSRDRSMIDRLFQKYLEIDSKYNETKPSLGNVCVCAGPECVMTQCRGLNTSILRGASSERFFPTISDTVDRRICWKPHRNYLLRHRLVVCKSWHLELQLQCTASGPCADNLTIVSIESFFIQASIPWALQSFLVELCINTVLLPLRFWL